MSSPIGYDGLSHLQVGSQVEYKAGQGNHRVEASVTVTKKPGSTGVFVTVNTIHSKGTSVRLETGNEVLAGAMELYR